MLGRAIKADMALAATPLVMLTSTLFKGEIAEAKQAGFSAYITKPIRKTHLQQNLIRVLVAGAGKPIQQSAETDAQTSCLAKLNARILLAEDNVVNQEVVVLMLQNFGCSVKIADNGLEALAAVERNHYDLALMDCMMPEMDGFAATAEIRRQQGMGKLAYFPIIALTANAIEGDREKCLSVGMDDYLAKPFKTEDLLRVLNKWLRKTSTTDNTLLLVEPEEAPILDLEILASLRALDPGHGDEVLQRIITIYLKNADKLIQTLEQAWHIGGVDNIRMAAHTLKSSSHQVGAHKLAELCRSIETEARNQHYDVTGQAMVSLQQHFNQVKAALQAHLKSVGLNPIGMH